MNSKRIDPVPLPLLRADLVAQFDVKAAIPWVAVFLLSLMAVVALQCWVNAYHVEFTSDEASHYVSGLLILSYVRAGFGAPIAFLRNFASHYPLVGIGHWGPAFYIVEALWMLVFGTSRTAVLLLSAGVTAAAATVCFAVARPRFGRTIAWLVTVAWIASPLTQESSSGLMLDAPVALALLLAALVYARFLSVPTIGNAAWFGLAAVVALLIKGNSLCLALLPPLAIVMTRRFSLLRVPAFWLPLPIVAVGAMPWYAFTWHLIAPGFRYGWGLSYIEDALAANPSALLAALGPLLLAGGLAGLIISLRRARRGRSDNAITCMAALLLAVVLFQGLVPAAIQDRYMLPALPPLLLLAAAALASALDWLRAHWVSARRRQWIGTAEMVMAVLCLTALLPTAVAPARNPQLGLIAAAPEVWTNLPAGNPVVLVVADAGIEPAAVAELALNDAQRPSMFAVRGSRLLGAGGYNNSDYKPRFDTPTKVMDTIDAYRVPLVLVVSGGEHIEWQHVRQVEAVIAADPGRWQPIWHSAMNGRQIVLYRIAGNASQPAPVQRLIALSAPHALGGHGP